MNLQSVMVELLKKGMLKEDDTASKIIGMKMNQFERLLSTSETQSPKQKYLNLYDGLFRLFEISLAGLNHVITNITPHKTFKILYDYLYPGLDNDIKLNELVKLRHSVKKNGFIPSSEEIKKLEKCVKHARNYINI